MTSPLVAVERTNAIARFDPAGGKWRRTEIVEAGFWPVISPRDPVLAVSTLGEGGSALELFGLDGLRLRTLSQAQAGVPTLIAPRIPHYALWAPTGEAICYVEPASTALALSVLDVDDGRRSNALATGAPIFAAWSPHGRFLAMHAGTGLLVVDIAGSRQARAIAEGSAVGFRAPVYSPAGDTLVFGEAGGGVVKVMGAQPDGSDAREICRFPGGVALAFRPGTSELTVAVALTPDSGVFDHVWTVDTSRQAPQPARLHAGPVTAFFWSPGGETLALIVPAQTGDGRYFVRAIDASGAIIGTTESFVPSGDYRTVLAFFDQYSKSHHLWSPDGSCFLAAGRLAGDAVSSSFGDPAGPYLMRWRASRGQPLEIVAAAEIGFYPPPPRM